MLKFSGFICFCLIINTFGQEDLYQDELSAPIVDDFLPSAPPSTSTAKPTAPSVLLPVEAVPAENLRADEDEDVVEEEVIEEVKVERFVESPSKIEEDIKVVTVERQPVASSREPQLQAEELLVDEDKPVVEEPKQAVQPQKVNRLRIKPSEVKKQEKPSIVQAKKPIDVKVSEFSEARCDSSEYDCQDCVRPKHIRNCKVKYFKDHSSIKSCEEVGEVPQNILDQCRLEVAEEVADQQ